MSEPYRFTLDGADVAVHADPKASALDVLRDQLGVFTIKAGCAPQGLCGCCTVLLDGKPRLTCTLPVKSLAGKSVTTIAGVPEASRERIAEAFVRTGAAQCGYCIPGIALSTHALISADPTPSDEAIGRALGVHTCRCTGYTGIVAGIRAAASDARGEGFGCDAVVRPEGHAVVLGDRPYVDDLVRPGLVHGCVVFAPSRGIVRAVTLPDPGDDGWGVALVNVGDSVAHVGVAVAAVAAADPARARALAARILVEVDAAGSSAPSGALVTTRVVDGDVDAAFAAAAHVVTVEMHAAPSDAVPLEPEAALAVPEADGGLVVYSAGHDAHAEAGALSARLGVPVRVLLVPSGGSYGAKEAPRVQEAAARLAIAARRPVRVALGHEEATRARPRRPGGRATARAAIDASGTLVALDVAVQVDGGPEAFAADEMVARAAGAIALAPPALRVSVSVHASAGDATAPVRGVGALACAAAERAVDAACAAAGLDPRAARRAALPEEARAPFDAVAADALADDAIVVARTDGAGGARVVLRVASADEVEVSCNLPELGQGRDEALAAALVAASGLPADTFTVAWGDSAAVGGGAPASASVDLAAAAAARALVAGGGALAARVGAVFVGEDTTRASASWCAARVRRGEGGRVAEIVTAVAIGAGQDARLAGRLAEGAAHMGFGIALTEEVAYKEGVADARFRVLGTLKPRHTPPLRALVIAMPGGWRDVSEAACVATAAAVACSVARDQPEAAARLPMKQSSAAAAAGIRPARSGEGVAGGGGPPPAPGSTGAE